MRIADACGRRDSKPRGRRLRDVNGRGRQHHRDAEEEERLAHGREVYANAVIDYTGGIGIFFAVLVIFGQIEGRDAATFRLRVAELDAREATLTLATSEDSRSVAALDWLRALRGVLEAIPVERATGPHEEWLKTHEDLLAYSEPAGEWLIRHDLIADLHKRFANRPAADEIAWFAATNGLPGECEGYVPCYASILNTLDGEYLRQHPRGAHRTQAFERLNETLRIVVDDLLKRPANRSDFLSVPQDCGDLLASLRPLRAAVAGANGAQTETMGLIDRLIAHCPAR